MNTASCKKWIKLSGLAIATSFVLSGCLGGGSKGGGNNDDDNTPSGEPSIHFNGEAVTKIKLGDTSSYSEDKIKALVEALDSEGNDLFDRIVVSGDKVDVNTSGEYTLKFSVTDSGNNTTELTHTVRVADYGASDKNFGINGLVTRAQADIDNPYGPVKDNQGNIFITGINSDNHLILMKFKDTGALDSSFGDDGIVTVINDIDDRHTAIKINQNNDIYIAGFKNPGSVKEVWVWKYLADGTLDTGFGTTGIAKITSDSISSIRDIAIDNAGNIYVGGEGRSSKAFFIAKFNANGEPATEFDSDGLKIVVSEKTLDIYALAINSKNQIILAGNTAEGLYLPKLSLWKFDQNANPVESFGSEGSLSYTEPGFDSFAYDVMTDDQDNIYVTGSILAPTVSSIEDMLLIKFNTLGQPVSDFGNQGVVKYNNPDNNGEFQGLALAQGGDSTIYIAGIEDLGQKAVVWSYNTQGQLTNHFGEQGIVKYDLGTGSTHGLLIDDERFALYLSGTRSTDTFLLKLIN